MTEKHPHQLNKTVYTVIQLRHNGEVVLLPLCDASFCCTFALCYCCIIYNAMGTASTFGAEECSSLAASTSVSLGHSN